MANTDLYVVERPLLDVTATVMAAGATVESATSGSKTQNGCTLTVTTNTITSTALQQTQVADALNIYAFPPVAADGSFPDCEIWLKVDGVDLKEFQLFNVQADELMCPWPHNVVGGPVDGLGKPLCFRLGRSLRSVLWDAVHGKFTPNMALECTGVKIQNQITLMVRSIAGWTVAALSPLRVIVTGEVLTEDQIRRLAPGWNGRVFKQVMHRDLLGKRPVDFAVDLGGPLSFSTWGGLPGGVKQRGNQIHRFCRWGKNAVATAAASAFPFSNMSELRAGATNVGPAAATADSDHDLGFNSLKDSNVMYLRGMGVRINPAAATAPNAAYAGWQVDGNVVPSENGNTGLVLRTRVNPFQFGSVQPSRPDSNLYTLIPRYPGELLIYGEAAVPVVAANGTAVAAGVLTVAVDGTYIKMAS